MRDLPPEILGTVFDLAGVSEGKPNALFTVAAVCKGWKQLILSNPRPWRTLRYDVPGNKSAEDIAEFISRWFSRSGSLPLTLELNCEFPASSRPTALAQLLVREPRWEALSFGTTGQLQGSGPLPDSWLHQLFEEARVFTKGQGRSCWGQLRCLKIDQVKLAFREYMKLPLIQIAPNLEDLEINLPRITNPDLLKEPFVNLKALRKLQISAHIPWNSDAMFTFLFKASLEATRLEHLKIHDLYDEEDMPDLPLPLRTVSFPVHNTALTFVDLCDSPAVRFYLSKLCLPALTSLTLYSLYHPFDLPPPITVANAIRQLVGQSGCRLRSLNLDSVAPLREDLPTLFRYLTRLEDLKLLMSYGDDALSTDTIVFLKEITTNPKTSQPATDILPSLQAFTVVDHELHPDFVPDLIVAFQTFVEDPRRACGGAITNVARITFEEDGSASFDWTTTGWDEDELPPASPTREGERRFSPLEFAHLYYEGFQEPLYSRPS